MVVHEEWLDQVTLVVRATEIGDGDRVAECVNGNGDQTFWLLRPLTGRRRARCMAAHAMPPTKASDRCRLFTFIDSPPRAGAVAHAVMGDRAARR